MENLKEIPKYTVEELEIRDEDLQGILSMGLVVSGTILRLFCLKKLLRDDPDIRVIYETISPAHLRIVKRDEWEEFREWKTKRKT